MTDAVTIARLEHLFERITKAKGKLIVPTPSLAEAFVHTQDQTASWVEVMTRKSAFVIAPFDSKAAVECALINRLAIGQGHKKVGAIDTERWQKVKIDRQIAAIAKVHQSDLLVTDDNNLKAVCKHVGINTTLVGELDVPASALQQKLELTIPKK